jgi:protein N-lysine methyltransferase METTL21D
MADVTYNTASFPSLIRTLRNLTHRSTDGNTATPLVLLGYKERDTAERSLWEMAREIGVTFERVGERPGADGNSVEIWLGRVLAVVDNQVSRCASWSTYRVSVLTRLLA